jgi:multidrug efflux pump subunit AcrA (membrane-fusion protein)
MLKVKRHIQAVVIAAAAGGWLVAGCSAHVSFGGPSAMSRNAVQTDVATTLARQAHQPVPTVVCPGNLQGKVGTVMYCSLTAQGSTTAYPVRVQVYSTSGSHIYFHVEVSTTPGHFTAPG